MSETADEATETRLKEFNIEFELLIASRLQGVPITAIKKFYGSNDMAAIVAKVLRPVAMRARR